MSESKLQGKIIKYIKRNGGLVIKTITTNTNGSPDLLICWGGKFIAFEVKNPNGKGVTSKLQKYRIKAIREAGGIAHVVSSMGEIIKYLK